MPQLHLHDSLIVGDKGRKTFQEHESALPTSSSYNTFYNHKRFRHTASLRQEKLTVMCVAPADL
jgi:hypothetical protein